jgi:hypothetical protein
MKPSSGVIRNMSSDAEKEKVMRGQSHRYAKRRQMRDFLVTWETPHFLVEPILPLALAPACASVYRSRHDCSTLCPVHQVASKRTIFKLERLLRILVLDGPVALHFIAVQVLLRCVTSMAIKRDRDGVRKRSWPLCRVRRSLRGALQERLGLLAACPDLHQESRLGECAA